MIAGTDPVAVDLAAVSLMGFDEGKLEKLRGPMEDPGPRITGVRAARDVRVSEIARGEQQPVERTLDEIRWERVFLPHAGWAGHVERSAES